MTLAAALALPLVLSAQTTTTTPPKYKYDAEKNMGYNKYLLSETPDDNGEYILRIENFITGKVNSHTLPTDFVLVLDISGSMIYDHKKPGQEIPLSIKKSENDAKADTDLTKLKPDDGCGRGYTHYPYGPPRTGGEVGQKASGTSQGSTWCATTNTPEHNKSLGNYSRFYLYGDRYYRIFRNASGGNRYVYFDLVDDDGKRILVNGQPQRKYLKQDGDDIIATDTMPTGYTADDIILLIDNRNNSGYKLYRYENRKDALIRGVNLFLDMILEQNLKDEIWEDGVTRHQVAVVGFGSCSTAAIPLTPSTGNTRVTRVFAPITSDNLSSYKNWDYGVPFNSGTDIGRGVETGRRLLQQLAANNPDLRPLNSAGGQKRNKVMVVFTDGLPNDYTASNSSTGYTGSRGHCTYAIEQGAIVKQKGKINPDLEYDEPVNNQQINGLIYTISLSDNNTYIPAFLQHLSSDFPQATSSGTSGSAIANQFGGTIGEKTGFYLDATAATSLSDAFKTIAEDNTGDMSSALVSVDQLTPDFIIPFTTNDLTKVKVYTAQCIGLTGETITDEQGQPHSELAFAQEIEVKGREALEHLWVYENNDWVDLKNLDIDNDTKFTVSEDGKTITLSGFDYAKLWCGEDLAHDNTRQPVAATDPNYGNQQPGYRGFKMIYEFPIKIDPEALGGVGVPTNTSSSGLWKATNTGVPTAQEVEYPKPILTIPVRLIVQKTGLGKGESANFTIQRKRRGSTEDYVDFITFVLTGGDTTPENRFINLDPAYYYKVKEENWSWAYEAVSPEYSTEGENPIKNPIVFENTPIPTPPPHAEAKATNKMTTWEGQTSSTETVNSK